LDVIEDNGVEQEIRLDNMPDTQVSRVSQSFPIEG